MVAKTYLFRVSGDDVSVSMISRGGPEKKQVTGWLQIMHAQKSHEGDYTCTAETDQGKDERVGRLNIVQHQNGIICVALKNSESLTIHPPPKKKKKKKKKPNKYTNEKNSLFDDLCFNSK